MLEGATAHSDGPPGLSQHFPPAVDVSSFLLFGSVHIVSLVCSLYIHFLHCIVRAFTQLASSCMSVLHARMLHTWTLHPLRKEHAL